MAVDQIGYLNIGAPGRNPFNFAKVEQIARDNTTAWLTQTEIQNQLNLFGDSSQSVYLTALEVAVRQAIEDFLGMSIFATSYRVWYNAASLYGTPLGLDLPDVSQATSAVTDGVSVTAVKYWTNDSTPVLTTLASDQYYYDPSGNKIVLVSLPTSLNSSITSPVFCEYTCAANPIASYQVVKQAGLMLLTHLYNTRTTVGTTVQMVAEIPFGVSTLLRPYKPLVM